MLSEDTKGNHKNSWQRMVRKELAHIQPYVSGKPIAQVAQENGLDRVIKLASNENPLGVSPLVNAAIARETALINRYPDSSSSSLKVDLCHKLGVQEDMILFGNGSDGLLKVIAEAFLDNHGEVVVPYPTFVEYVFVSQLMGSSLQRVPLQEYIQDLPGIAATVNDSTKMVFLTNPHNPVGTIFSRTALESFLVRLPDSVVTVIDEAYHEYVQSTSYPDGVDYVKAGYPVIVLRTFSKAYGLAGLRLGYAIASPAIIGVLAKARDPFNVNHLAEQAGKAALADADFLSRTIVVNEEGKRYLYRELERLGLAYVPTEANFILVDVKTDSLELFQKLLAQGVIVRPGQPLGFPEHIRVTIGTKEENQTFIDALTSALE